MHDSGLTRNGANEQDIKVLTLRIPQSLAERLRLMAEAERRSVNGQIERLLEEAVDRHVA